MSRSVFMRHSGLIRRSGLIDRSACRVHGAISLSKSQLSWGVGRVPFLSSIACTARSIVVLFIVFFSSVSNSQVGVYQTLESFLSENFKQSPSNEILWLNDEIRSELSDVLDRNYRGLRIRYWRDRDRTAWILNEIGKERPITSGIVVERGKILAVSVLEYRESRGGEVQLASFRRQFINASLNDKGKLNSRIDGITGATMSVRTLNRSVIAALKLHSLALDGSGLQ